MVAYHYWPEISRFCYGRHTMQAPPGPKGWQKFNCPGSVRQWRQLDDWRIEYAGEGMPVWSNWPSKVNERAPLIEASAAKYGVPAVYIAAIMALETRGENVCIVLPWKICYSPDCPCVNNEGCGLMATLRWTADGALGRPRGTTTCRELMTNLQTAVDAGTAYLKDCLERNGWDFVKAGVAYNAGSVRCGRGSTPKITKKDGTVVRRRPLPDTGWGVIVGGGWSDKSYGARCAPAQPGYNHKAYVCTSEYPKTVGRILNAALINYAGHAPGPEPPGPEPVIPVEPETASGFDWKTAASMAVGAVAGYLLIDLMRS